MLQAHLLRLCEHDDIAEKIVLYDCPAQGRRGTCA